MSAPNPRDISIKREVETVDLTYDSDGDYQYERPGPVFGNDEFYAQEILDINFVISDDPQERFSVEYLVHWQGWSLVDTTWEPSENLVNSPQVVQEFCHENYQLISRRYNAFREALGPAGQTMLRLP